MATGQISTLQSSASRTSSDFSQIPAINRWAIVSRPLHGLGFMGAVSDSRPGKRNGPSTTNSGFSEAASGLEQVADQPRDNYLRQSVAETDRQTVAVRFDVCRLDDVLGFDHRRSDSAALYLVLCAARGRVRRS